MATVSSYHTDSPEYPEQVREVYHDKDTYPEGKKINPQHRRIGTNNKRLCKICPTVT